MGKSQAESFVRLFTTNHNNIYAFILTLMPNWADADDIMQETAATMWQKFDQFQKGSNFTAWGTRVAYLEVLEFRRKHRKHRSLLEQEILEVIANRSRAKIGRLQDYLEALEKCMSKLSQRDYELVRMRYERFNTIKELSHYIGRPIHGLYKAMERIHKALLECVRRRLAQVT